MLDEILEELRTLDLSRLYEQDFQRLEEKTEQELAGIFAVADALRELREKNYDLRVFRSGLAIAGGVGHFGAFAAGCEMLGLRAMASEDLDLVGTLADVAAAGEEIGDTCTRLYQDGVLEHRPLAVDPDTALPYLLFLIHRFNGVGAMKGQRVPIPEEKGRDLPVLAARFGLEMGEEMTSGAEWLKAESYRPFIIAAMIFLGKCPQPVKMLEDIRLRCAPRRLV